jgi:biopolymer transport protein ExbD
VDITPLIDVVFLLLIFFMVSTTFERETQILIELPEASGDPNDTLSELAITIDREGVFYVNQQEVVNTEIETLKTAIGKAVGDKRDIPVIIAADAMTPHQAVMTVMDAASQMGLLHMTFTAQQPRD